MSDAMKAGRANYMRVRQMMHGIKRRPKGERWRRYNAITADHTHEDGSEAEYLE